MTSRDLAIMIILVTVSGLTATGVAGPGDPPHVMIIYGNSATRSLVLWPPNAPDPGDLPLVFGAAGPLAQPLRVRMGETDEWCQGITPIPGLTVPYLQGFGYTPTLAFASPTGTLAGPADAQGYAAVVLPLRGGGYAENPLHWLLSGPGMTCAQNWDQVKLNSPDLNGDLVMNLADLLLFTQRMYGPYQYRADFNSDQVINLSDLVYFARAYGTYAGSATRE